VLDEQHKQWINIYNELHEKMISYQRDNSISMAPDALQSMQEYAKYHFTAEEEYMDKIGYPDFAMHRRLHKDFDSNIFQYNQDIRDGKLVLSSEIMKELKNWLLKHILIEDRKYCLFATAKTNPRQ